MQWVLLDLEWLRLLRLVRVLATGKHMELLEHAPAEGILRQHALDRELDRPLGMLGEELLERDRLDAADVAGVVVVDLVGELAPGDADLLRVHHHDVIAHIDVGAVVSLVLALQTMGDLRGEAPQRLVARVDDEPVAADGRGLGKYGLHRSLVAAGLRSAPVPSSAAAKKRRASLLKQLPQCKAPIPGCRPPPGSRRGACRGRAAAYNRGRIYGVRPLFRRCDRRPRSCPAVGVRARSSGPTRTGRRRGGAPQRCAAARERRTHARQSLGGARGPGALP